MGVTYVEALGKATFYSLLIGTNLVFGPQHNLGFNGMQRRVPIYPDAFSYYNAMSSAGSIISLIALLLFMYTFYASLAIAKPAYVTGHSA